LDYDQKEFLELLHPFKSDETMKARRNVSTIAFLVLALWMLDISIKDVSVFGVTLKQSSELGILAIAIVLLVYWLGMFLLAWLQDKEIQKERSYILEDHISTIVSRFEKMDADKKKREENGQTFMSSSYGQLKASYELYKAQEGRTKKAGTLVSLVRNLEIFVPMILAICALLVLISGVVHAASQS